MNQTPPSSTASERQKKLPLPGMAAIALWMLLLASMGVFGVLHGDYARHSAKIVVLAICTLFAIGALGLIRLYRWGWALTLGAVFLCMCFGFYSMVRFHQPRWIVMSLLNLVFFLYLARGEVIGRLR